MTYYESPVARVYYDQELDTLFLSYFGKVKNHDQFVEINTAVLNAFRQLNTQKFVADIRHMGLISVESQRWVVDVLLPGMIKHLNGKMLFHAQLLDPKEVLAKVSASNIRNKSSQVAEGFEVRQFHDEEEMRQNLLNWQAFA
jgi:hypothetical protein